MSDKWMLRGSEYSNCNCDYGCPCQFNAPSTHGKCEAVGSGIIEEGYFNDIRLDGLKYVILLKWPGEIAEGNGKMQIYIDERANDEQRGALKRILHGESTEPGATHFFVFNSTMSEVLETKYVPIELSIDVEAREGSLNIPGVIQTSGTPIIDPFSNKPMRAHIGLPDGFEYTVAEMGSGTTKCTAPSMELDFSSSYGQFNILHMNQDGVIR